MLTRDEVKELDALRVIQRRWALRLPSHLFAKVRVKDKPKLEPHQVGRLELEARRRTSAIIEAIDTLTEVHIEALSAGDDIHALRLASLALQSSPFAGFGDGATTEPVNALGDLQDRLRKEGERARDVAHPTDNPGWGVHAQNAHEATMWVLICELVSPTPDAMVLQRFVEADE